MRLVDDDAYWNGTLKDKYAERNFRMRLSRANGVLQACFVAGEGNDGLPLVSTNGAPATSTNASGTSLSEGIIPAGCTTNTVNLDSATNFFLTSPPLPAGSGGIFAGNASLVRIFSLLSTTANTNHVISPSMIIGTYEERIGITNTQVSYLDQTNTGAFVLVRDLPSSTVITNGVLLPPTP